MASLHAPGRNHRFSLQVHCADAILDVVVSAVRWAAQALCTAWHLGERARRAQTRRADAAVSSPHLTHERPPGGVAHQHVAPLQRQFSDWLRRFTKRADLQEAPSVHHQCMQASTRSAHQVLGVPKELVRTPHDSLAFLALLPRGAAPVHSEAGAGASALQGGPTLKNAGFGESVSTS